MALENLRHGSIKTVYASVARTATPAAAEFVCADPAIKGILILVNVTALAATPSVVPTLKVMNRTVGSWVAFHAFTAITNVTGTGLYVFFIYPNMPDLSLGDVCEELAGPIPTHFQFSLVHADTDSMTYSVELQCLR